MTTSPRVSIVIPVFNDEEWVSGALESAIVQTETAIEIICVDDASSDRTCEVIEQYQARDPRIRLIRQPTNQSAFQARRAAVMQAEAPYVLFLDGDDELIPRAAQHALEVAHRTGADVVGFGVEVVAPEGVSVGRFAADMQPSHPELLGEAIVPALFPVGSVAQGHLWRYLWDIRLLRHAYETLPEDLRLYRANDMPISFLALTAATRYVSTPYRLYRYFWRRGVSGQQIHDMESFDFYLSAWTSIDSIANGVEQAAARMADPDPMRASYRSAQLSFIQMILRYCVSIPSDELRAQCLAKLQERVGGADVVLAAVSYFNKAIPVIAENAGPAPELSPSVRTVLITTGNLGSGGLQGVVVSQAKHLVEAGFNVVIGLRTLENIAYDVPHGVDLVEIEGNKGNLKLESFITICRDRQIDVVIDHWVLYYDAWPEFALAARALGIPTIGWLHNFALRPFFDFSPRTSLLASYLPLLTKVVVLSETDVAFWKMVGVDHAVYLPNPPSPLLLETKPSGPRVAPHQPVRLFWCGRLQQHTKRVRDLIEVAAALRDLGIEFELTIIGPDSKDASAAQLRADAQRLGVNDVVVLPGPMYGDDLRAAMEDADLYLNTSAIEGYPLTLIEAQTLGLPVVMYELPWLAVARDNDGIVTAPQGEPERLAAEIAALVSDTETYARRSEASLAAAQKALSGDFCKLYAELITTPSSDESAPEVTLDDARLLMKLAIEFHDASVRRQQRYEGRLEKTRDRQERHIERLEARVLALRNKLQRERGISTTASTAGGSGYPGSDYPGVRVADVQRQARQVVLSIPGVRPAARRARQYIRQLANRQSSNKEG